MDLKKVLYSLLACLLHVCSNAAVTLLKMIKLLLSATIIDCRANLNPLKQGMASLKTQ